jgi:anti-sigma B factor antagonist
VRSGRPDGAVSEGIAQPVTLRCFGPCDDVVLVSLRGEFDIETVPDIDVSLRRALGPFYFRRHIVIDLADTTLVDSTFVGYVVRLSRRVRDAGREVLLVRPTGHVRRTLLLVGLPNLLPVYDSLDEALGVVETAHSPIIPPPLPMCPPPVDLL